MNVRIVPKPISVIVTEVINMNGIKVFEHEKFGKVRTVLIDGEPWFVGKDVALCLAYRNPQKAIRDHVDDEDKTVNKSFTVNGTAVILINESGMYSLVLGSKKPEAKDFKRWITSDVLPSIRKFGMYATPETLEKMICSPENMINICTMLLNEQKKNKKLTAENAELSKKCSYLDKILQSKNAISVTVIAKDYGMSAQVFNDLLHFLGIQYKLKSGTWVLYQQYAGCGYTRSKTYQYDEDKITVHTNWTQKGRAFLYDFLKKYGYKPMCEQQS